VAGEVKETSEQKKGQSIASSFHTWYILYSISSRKKKKKKKKPKKREEKKELLDG